MTHGWPYVCPRCHGPLTATALSYFHCFPCGLTFPCREGIPDFLVGGQVATERVGLQRPLWFDWVAGIYEVRPFYPILLRIYAGLRVSYARMLAAFAGLVGGIRGVILDVGCGPGTLPRLLADPGREFHGVDMSLGMLRRAKLAAAKEGLTSLHLVRALAEALPFPDAFFDAAVSGVTLHLLPEPRQGLAEIMRTLKPGAPLVASTIIAGREGLFRFPFFRRLALTFGVRSFQVAELQSLLAKTGFRDFTPLVFGSLLLFRAQKIGE